MVGYVMWYNFYVIVKLGHCFEHFHDNMAKN